MEISTNNLEFEYIHRDEGNYKIFGSIIFANPSNISPEEANEIIKDKLIDEQYFYPKDAKIPLFNVHSGTGIYFSDWYEYLEVSPTNTSSTDKRTIEVFIKDLEKIKH